MSEDVVQGNVSGSLAGRNIVVTRAVPQAKSLIEAISANGGTPVALPLLEIIDAADGGRGLAQAFGKLGPADWLVVLSPNGAKRVIAQSSDIDVTMRPQLAVIARGTERVFVDAGWSVDLVPEVASSFGLLAAFTDISVEGRVLIAQAENGRVELADGLVERGIDVEVVVAYRNVLPDLDPSSVARAAASDTVVFASPSAVERYVRHIGDQPSNAVCIGDVTSDAAVGAGFSVVTCSAPTVEAIVAALFG